MEKDESFLRETLQVAAWAIAQQHGRYGSILRFLLRLPKERRGPMTYG